PGAEDRIFGSWHVRSAWRRPQQCASKGPQGSCKGPHSAVKFPLKGRIMRFRAVRNSKTCLPLKGGAFVTVLRDKLTRKPRQRSLHVVVIGPVSALRRHPSDVLRRILHVAGFAMD